MMYKTCHGVLLFDTCACLIVILRTTHKTFDIQYYVSETINTCYIGIN